MKWSARMKHWSFEKFKEILFIKEMNKYYPTQGAKKIIFTACHLGKLKRSISYPRCHFN